MIHTVRKSELCQCGVNANAIRCEWIFKYLSCIKIFHLQKIFSFFRRESPRSLPITSFSYIFWDSRGYLHPIPTTKLSLSLSFYTYERAEERSEVLWKLYEGSSSFTDPDLWIYIYIYPSQRDIYEGAFVYTRKALVYSRTRKRETLSRVSMSRKLQSELSSFPDQTARL